MGGTFLCSSKQTSGTSPPSATGVDRASGACALPSPVGILDACAEEASSAPEKSPALRSHSLAVIASHGEASPHCAGAVEFRIAWDSLQPGQPRAAPARIGVGGSGCEVLRSCESLKCLLGDVKIPV